MTSRIPWPKVCRVWRPLQQRVCNGKVKSNGKFHVCLECGVSYGMDRRRREYRRYSEPKNYGTDSQEMAE